MHKICDISSTDPEWEKSKDVQKSTKRFGGSGVFMQDGITQQLSADWEKKRERKNTFSGALNLVN